MILSFEKIIALFYSEEFNKIAMQSVRFLKKSLCPDTSNQIKK